MRRVELDENRSRPLAPSSPYLIQAQRPVWFTIAGEGTPTSVEEEAATPAAFSLAQNFPNPFNSQTQIRYNLPTAGQARLEIFDLLGRRVALLHDSPLPAGPQTLAWDGRDGQGRAVASGVYFYRLEAGNAELTRKLLLLR